MCAAIIGVIGTILGTILGWFLNSISTLLVQIPVYRPGIRHIALGRDHVISPML